MSFPQFPWLDEECGWRLPQLREEIDLFRFERYPSVNEVAAYIGGTNPEIFIEPFADGAKTTLALLLANRVQSGVLVASDPYIFEFWREAIETEDMIRKVAGFKISQDRVDEVVNHPDQDRALWALVKSQCSWRGRLDATGFLLANVARYWNGEWLVHQLRKVRSMAPRLRVIKGDGIEVIKEYREATVYAAPPLYSRRAPVLEKDEWYLYQRRLLDTLGRHEGPWMVDYDATSEFWWSAPMDGFDRIGGLWRVPRTITKFPYVHNAILVSNPDFAWERHKLLPERCRVMR